MWNQHFRGTVNHSEKYHHAFRNLHLVNSIELHHWYNRTNCVIGTTVLISCSIGTAVLISCTIGTTVLISCNISRTALISCTIGTTELISYTIGTDKMHDWYNRIDKATKLFSLQFFNPCCTMNFQT